MKLLLCAWLVGCGSRIDRAESLIDDAEYIEARAVLMHEPCLARNETPRCALAHALVADGVGDRATRDDWTARADVLARGHNLSSPERARLNALIRRVIWEREVEQRSGRSEY